MNNKSLLVFLVLVIVILSGVLLILYSQTNSYDIKEFDVKDYQDEIDTFHSDENIGAINDTDDLLTKIEKIWIMEYGEQVKQKKPYQLFYDKNSDVWLIHGTLPDGYFGGVAYAIVDNKTGQVLAVWHDK